MNRHKPHIFVLPEDDANRQLANGFLLHPALSVRAIRILEEAGGWLEVLAHFLQDHVVEMERYPERLMILLIDFDNREERLETISNRIPAQLTGRVFVLGSLNEPEDLKRAIPGSTYELIGRKIAQDCRDRTDETWGHPLLRHNATELIRMREVVFPILFPGN